MPHSAHHFFFTHTHLLSHTSNSYLFLVQSSSFSNLSFPKSQLSFLFSISIKFWGIDDASLFLLYAPAEITQNMWNLKKGSTMDMALHFSTWGIQWDMCLVTSRKIALCLQTWLSHVLFGNTSLTGFIFMWNTVSTFLCGAPVSECLWQRQV